MNMSIDALTALRRRHPLNLIPARNGHPLTREGRSNRVMEHLQALRAPLAGLDLDNRDQDTLTWLADRDAEAVDAVRALLERARAAPPLSG
ncbi:hypothetical protein [Saccharopolyspora taberi]|uniref:TubC N-terminal docking domain-containing protein n=1 Tax=Saccharopolyspora taberi TaxID=60895 RepID=A0ABN3V705_9PSEU